MYLDYFGLKEKPFSLSPDPKYLFYSQKHKEALAQMIYAATQDTGFMVLTGEVGTGKTILINALIKQFPAYNFAKIYHSASSPEGLIQNICKEFRLDFVNRTMAQLVLKIQDYLKWNFNAGGKSILILDEAQNLGTATLEEIRLLSNFEAAHKKIMQIYLVGQPELESNLRNENLRQLRERVSLKFKLEKLNHTNTKLYITHRLRVAGLSERRNIFFDDAISEIYNISGGVPRRINILCDNALLIGYSKLYRRIDKETVKKAAIHCQMDEYSSTVIVDKNIKSTSIGKKTVNTVVANPVTKTKTSGRTYSVNGNGVVDYQKIEKIVKAVTLKNKGFFTGKLRTGKFFLAGIMVLLFFVLAFLLAIFIAVKFGILK